MKRQKGFTLLEILIVVALIAVMYASIPSIGGSSREQLQEAIDKIERGVRFAQNESVLRNTIIRLKLNLTGEETQSYSIDYGPSDTLPLPDLKDLSDLTIKQREAQKKIVANVDRQFNPIPEMEDQDLDFPPNIIVQGVGLSGQNFIHTEDSYSLYFYPTGEKDSAIIFLSSIKELATIAIEAFTPEPYVDYHYLESDDVDLLEREIKKYYEEWRSN